MSKFEKMLTLNVNGKTEKKSNLTYLSWAWAWAEFVKICPDATYEIVKNENGMPYFKDESGAFCYTKVTAEGITHEMWLPVMDHRNKTIQNPNAFDINKTVMRCLTKNLAMFGLGLYIYAGEDLPESIDAITNASESQVADIDRLIEETGSERDKFLSFFSVKNVTDLTAEQAVKAIAMLHKKMEKAS